MGYYGKLKEKEIAIKLRKNGLSYKEIQKQVKVSKDTLSRWCRDIFLDQKQLERLVQLKKEGTRRGSFLGARKNYEKRIKETNEQLERGIKEIGRLTNREKFLIGTALYAAEGTKGDKANAFANSDPLLIKFMVDWFREFCRVPEKKLRGALWIHEGLNIHEAIKYWSNLTGIPIFQFHKTYIAKNKIGSKKIRKNKHKWGVLSVRFSNAKAHRKMMGWIAGITQSQML